ncbi:hypothetical protein QE400_000088 [Xanthomonas sacchari]|uniref:hypothetical protein n=1 Tax=Xanthomonas sacchari TaxID=56458 RepID=UPI00277E53C8|nr:hypothetical protein [Xanthomonas sacchari]MDQ1090675.1 hypothetical protein [Xanthomonas sacchari]
MGALSKLMAVPPTNSAGTERSLVLLDDMRRLIDSLGDITRGYSQLSHRTKKQKLKEIHLQLRDARDELARLVATNKEA